MGGCASSTHVNRTVKDEARVFLSYCMKDTQMLVNAVQALLEVTADRAKSKSVVVYLAESCSLGLAWMGTFKYFLHTSHVYFVFFSDNYGRTPTTKLELNTILTLASGVVPEDAPSQLRSEHVRQTRSVVIVTDEANEKRLKAEFLSKHPQASECVSVCVTNRVNMTQWEDEIRYADQGVLVNMLLEYDRLALLSIQSSVHVISLLLSEIFRSAKCLQGGPLQYLMTARLDGAVQSAYKYVDDPDKMAIPIMRNRDMRLPTTDDELDDVVNAVQGMPLFSYEYTSEGCKIVEASPKSRVADKQLHFGVSFPANYVSYMGDELSGYTTRTIVTDSLSAYMQEQGLYSVQGLFVPSLVAKEDKASENEYYVPSVTKRIYNMFLAQVHKDALLEKDGKLRINRYTKHLLSTVPIEWREDGSKFSF